MANQVQVPVPVPVPVPVEVEVRIRSVWAYNLDEEFYHIRNIVERYPFAAMDTEFPGVIYLPQKHHTQLTNPERYAILKANVDDLRPIQLGLTLSDAAGNLPDLGTGGAVRYIWEFNFRDFDIHRDRYAAQSINLLIANGIDFEKNRTHGIDSRVFGALLMSSGLVCNNSAMTWLTFHSAYDFGYLVKILTGRRLPIYLDEFTALVKVFFGYNMFDMKHMIKFCHGLYGGLDRVAGALQVNRVVGLSHQAGSDSLLTMQAFNRMKEIFFLDGTDKDYAGIIFGLESN